jgi:hypothetical protein
MYLQPISRRGSHNGQSAQADTLPPPVLGLNTKDALPFLKPGHAVVLDNWWTAGNELQTRRGAQALANFAGGSLHVYHGAVGQELLVAHGGAIGVYNSALNTIERVTTNFTGPATSQNFATAAGQFLIAVNGIQDLHVFDGTTWQALDDTSTPAFTGVATSLLEKVAVHQRRLWFLEKNSLNAWYLPPDVFAGAAQKFSLGSIFTRGGKLVNVFTWSVDGGAGQDDLLCFYSSAGEVAVYSGIDPSSPDTWGLVGVYYVGEPVFGAPYEKFGGDIVLITVRGIFLLSQALQTSSLSNRYALTDLINPTFQAIAAVYGATEGWSIAVIPGLDMMLIATPVGQFAANVTNKAWHRFIGWGKISSLVVFNQLPYFFKDELTLCRGWTGTSDYGQDIVATAVQAPNRLKRAFANKHVSLMRPMLKYSSSFVLRVGVVKDHDFDPPTYDYTVGNQAGVGVWNESEWNEAVWASGLQTYDEWLSVPQDPGLWLAPALQVVTRGDIVRWVATDLMFEPGSIL